MINSASNSWSALFISFRHFLVLSLIVAMMACGGSNPTSGGGDGGVGGGGGGGGTGGNGAFTAGQTKYVRTDATTPYLGWINAHWIVYNPPTKHFFVTDPYSNRLIVLDAVSKIVVGTIGVPGAFSIDDTADHRVLYVGTMLGDLYTINPVAMVVTKRYLGSQIGPDGYFAFSALVMADGRLALLGEPGGFPSVDGSSNFAVWNPADNSLVFWAGAGQNGNAGCGSMGNIGGFSRSVDRKKVIIASVFSDATLCEIDEISGQAIYVGTQASFTVSNFRTTPDGQYIIVPGYPGGVNVFDTGTLSPLNQFSISGDSSTASGFFVSADSSTLFTPSDTLIYAYNLSTQQQIGWLPNMNVQPTSGGSTVGPSSAPNLQASDGSGIFAGPLEQGVGFIDTSIMRTGPLGTQFTNGYLSPATGVTSGGTSVQLPNPNPFGSLSAMFFGSTRATQLSGSAGTISATTPAGNPGPVDVYTFTADGGFQLLPEAYSYGPTILQVTPNISTAQGGGTGYIFGYGFGPVSSGTTVPPALRATVGGSPVQLTGLYSSTGAPPFPMQIIAYTIPPGLIGNADVSVTSSSGTVTAHSALTYLPSTQQFSLPGAALAQGIYDPYRDLYYFTDAAKIQVFSKTQGTWLTPLSIPAPPGTAQRLWGIALSPDGSKLAVSDASAGVVYLLNPSGPGSVKTFAVNANGPGLVVPAGLAVSDAGFVYYAMSWQGNVFGASAFYKLNTATGTITDYRIAATGSRSDLYLRAAISADNTRAFFNDDGQVFYVDTVTDKISWASVDPGCCYGNYELTLASDQTMVSASNYIYDSNLNAGSYYSLNNREILTASYVYGAKLSPNGSLLFQPSTGGIDVMDGQLGNLLNRIVLPFVLSPNDDALVSDGKDNILVAITGTTGDGIAIIDLSSISEPPPVPFLNRSSHSVKRLSHWESRTGVSVSATMERTSRKGGKESIPSMRRVAVGHVTVTHLFGENSSSPH